MRFWIRSNNTTYKFTTLNTHIMKLISHRGNITASNPTLENTPGYIELALATYDCEVDIWFDNKKFYLGHDGPKIEVSKDFVTHPGLWCHAKHYASLQALLDVGAHCFFHKHDDYTVTSKGVIWAYPGKKGDKNTVCVHPHELDVEDVKNFYGVCANNIKDYEDIK